MALSEEQIAFRKKGIGGSDATRIMKGDWHSLWLEKTGRAEPEDLSDVLPVQLGAFTEEFNRQWYEKQTGNKVSTDLCEMLEHPDFPHLQANLDGRIYDGHENPLGIWEAKHVNQFKTMDECVQQYYAQGR